MSPLRCDAPPCTSEQPDVATLAKHLIDEHQVPGGDAMRRAWAVAGKTTKLSEPPIDRAVAPLSLPTEAAMTFAPKPCPDCKKTFTPTGPAAKRCPPCAKERKLQSDRDRSSGGGAAWRRGETHGRAHADPGSPVVEAGARHVE